MFFQLQKAFGVGFDTDKEFHQEVVSGRLGF
jgi:hypothetical protein